ncbi:MAG: MerR family transcriptional regulator [Acidimicrobiales bacterium]
MNERAYLSIGDVLTLLRAEFPDITISKIRFLESRGLLVPERTPSGYRKFYDHDVDRLRWILRQQRENFLPLKVIKGRLDGQEPSSEPTPLFEVAGTHEDVPLEPVFAAQQPNGAYSHGDEVVAHASAPAAGRESHGREVQSREREGREVHGGEAEVRGPQLRDPEGALAGVASATKAAASVAAGRTGRVGAGTGSITPRPAADGPGGEAPPPNGADPTTRPAESAVEPARAQQPAAARPAAAVAAAGRVVHAGGSSTGSAGSAGAVAARGPHGGTGGDLGAKASSSSGAPPGATSTPAGPASGKVATAASPPASQHGPTETAAHPDSGSLAGASLTAGELAQASGLDVKQVEELESYGLIESHLVAGVHCFDEDALVVAGLAAGFARFGVEARHLRMFKHAAERQASMYSQIVMPLLRQRNPDARRRAHDDLVRLSELGASMQACFAKAVLRDLTRG